MREDGLRKKSMKTEGVNEEKSAGLRRINAGNPVTIE
jgi:hypothetical protein